MKISIELTDAGELIVDSGDEEPDVLQVNALLDVAKLNLVTSFMRGMVDATTPEETDDEVSV